MKFALFILALIATPCVLSIYKSITTDHSLSPDAREGLKSYTTNGLESPYDEAIRVAYSKGYDGDTVYLNKQKKTKLLSVYLEGAASAGHRELVMPCINKGADPNAGLRGAARSGRMDMVQLMLESGATDYGIGLKGAAGGGHMDIIKLMLDKGANPNMGLSGAAMYKRVAVMKLLLEKGATDYHEAFDMAVEHPEIAQLIFEKHARSYNGFKKLAKHNHQQIIELMLKRGANPNAALEGAAEGGHGYIVVFLLKKGATGYNAALRGAAKAGHMYIVKMMLDKGADPYVGLHIAAEYGHTEIIKYLLANTNVNINKKDVYGKTPLDKATRSGNPECVKFILAAGGV